MSRTVAHGRRECSHLIGDRPRFLGFSGSFDAASEDVLMRHQKGLGCGFKSHSLAGLRFHPLPDLRGRGRPRSKFDLSLSSPIGRNMLELVMSDGV